MSELIKITATKEGTNVVSARELYECLTIKAQFTDWMHRMLAYGFEEGRDYTLHKFVKRHKTGATSANDYAITLDMAKEIAMLQRTEAGKILRRYLIECEKFRNSFAAITPPQYIKTIELLKKCEVLVGSYNKLATMMGVSGATLSTIISGKQTYSAEMIHRIETFCGHFLNKGVGYDREITDMLIGIDNKALRQKLFKKFKESGML